MLSIAFMTGVNENEVKSRRKSEVAQIKKVQQPIDAVLKELKEDGDWKVISLNELRKKYKVGGTQNYNKMVYSLQSNANIISRPSKVTESNKKAGEISATTPLEYKYVSAEEKQKMGFDAQVFRHIAFGRKDLIVSAFNSAVEKGLLKKEDVRPVDILASLEYLYNKHATEGWIYLEPIRMAGETGVSIDRLATAVTQLQTVHLLVVTVVSREGKKGNKLAAIGVITSTEEKYSKRLEETRTPENITVLQEKASKRASREQAAQKRLALLDAKLPALKAIEEKTGDISEKDISDVINQSGSAEDEQLKSAAVTEESKESSDSVASALPSPEAVLPVKTDASSEAIQNGTNIQGMNLQFEQIYSKILEQGKVQLQKAVESYVKKQTAEYQRQIKALEKTIEKKDKDSAQYESRISKLQERLDKSERRVKAFTKFNDAFIENAEDQLNAFVGQALNTFKGIEKMYRYERNDPKRMNKINRILFDLINATTNNISNFRPDNYPPALKN